MLARDELDDHVRAAAAVYRGVRHPSIRPGRGADGATRWCARGRVGFLSLVAQRLGIRRQALGQRTNNESDEPHQESVDPSPSPRIDRVRATVTAILPAVWLLLPARVSASTTSRRRSPS